MKFSRLFVVSLAVFVLALSIVSSVSPSGASSLIVESSTRAPADLAASSPALAGNVTELSITGFSTTQSWQGYFGNVSGTIQLADVNDKVMYNWSVADPSGEVYASTVADTINWSSIDCFDWATNGVALETTYGIGADDVDGINETFTSTDHTQFYSNNRLMSTCMTAYIYDSTEASVTGNFEQVILADSSNNVVWTALLEEGSVDGFDGKDHDFEMLVPENGHLADASTTTYYFYVELE